MSSDPNWNSDDGYLMDHYKDEGKSEHPVDYFVPDFGVDADIIATSSNTALAEKDLDHKWNPVPAD